MLWPDSILECVLTPPPSHLLPSPPLPHAMTSINTNNRPNAAEIDDSHIVILRNIRLNMPPGVGTPRKIQVGVCALLETLTLFQTRPMLTRYNKYEICHQLSFLLYPKLSYLIDNDSRTVIFKMAAGAVCHFEYHECPGAEVGALQSMSRSFSAQPGTTPCYH